jgi:hypothetical protein
MFGIDGPEGCDPGLRDRRGDRQFGKGRQANPGTSKPLRCLVADHTVDDRRYDFA